jgi:hypothetical protein
MESVQQTNREGDGKIEESVQCKRIVRARYKLIVKRVRQRRQYRGIAGCIRLRVTFRICFGSSIIGTCGREIDYA